MTTDIPNDQTEAQPAILFFAYGTLRQGEGNHGWIEEEIISEHGEASTRFARLHYGRNHRGYPYLIATDNPNDVTTGEVYTLPLNDQVMAMLQMEVNAGYTLGDIEVTLADESNVMAVACLWEGIVGEQVPDNNWKSPERMEFWR